jgi:hypothetical protein
VSAEFAAICKATNKANPTAEDMARLAEYFLRHPEDGDALGNLANQVELNLLEIFKHSVIQRVTLQAYAKNMRVDLGRDTAPPLEKNLIDHVVICWLRMHIVELQVQAQNSTSLSVADFWERKLTATQKRYLRAVETLARIRKLSVNIQVNIGDKQIINAQMGQKEDVCKT